LKIPIPKERMSTGGRKDSRDWAMGLAIEGLAFLGSDPERLGPFLALTGLDPANLRAAARAPSFLTGVLDHLAGDERLLIAFAAEANRDPTDISRARQILDGPAPDWGP
jgi:hypothetical protein